MEDTPIFREVADAQCAARYRPRTVVTPGGRHHWRDDQPAPFDPYGDVPEPRR